VKASGKRHDAGEIRVLRIISRLNVGGPAIQAITLTRRMEPLGYRTTLLRGREGPREGCMDDLAEDLGVAPVPIGSLRRGTGAHDVAALDALVRAYRKVRPHIVHTHAAKAGALGRAAALMAGRPGRRPILLHTFHGHSLTGYFGSRAASRYLRIERFLARHTARLVAVSAEVREELVTLGVAPADRFEVVPVGFELSPFLVNGDARARARAAVRAELGIPADARVVTLVARLVPIKRVDRFLRLAGMLGSDPDLRFLIVGDGELAAELHSCPEAHALGDRLVWAGLRQDMPAVCAASDVVALTSDNEGTPVSLIEAQAAGLPVVSTAVGGVPSVVANGETGWLARRDEEQALAAGLRRLLADRSRAAEFGARGRRRVTAAFPLDRLVADMDSLYRRLLEEDRASRRSTTWALPRRLGHGLRS
jgi:glycosyltransferase involved in cell wall biosynthesis